MSYTPEYVQTAIDLITETYRQLRPELMVHYGNVDHTTKRDLSVVTELDVKVEQTLQAKLAVLDPRIGFSGEEVGVDYDSHETYWLADGIDGTEQFVRGIPQCCNMIALIHQNEPVAAVIYNFPLDAMYTAIKGQGAFKNGESISVSDRPGERAVVQFESNLAKPGMSAAYEELLAKTWMVLEYACSGYGYILVAEGALEARIALNSFGKPWDYAPGSLLVREAGGVVRNIGSDTYGFRNLDYVASNAVIADSFQEVLSRYV